MTVEKVIENQKVILANQGESWAIKSKSSQIKQNWMRSSESNSDRETARANSDQPGKNLDRGDRQCCKARNGMSAIRLATAGTMQNA